MALRRFSRGSRRKTEWAGFGNSVGAAALPTPVSVLTSAPRAILSLNVIVGGGLGFLDQEVTITRMIGQLMIAMNTSVAEAQASWAVGCIVERNEAAAAGIGSMPSPEDDPNSEWLFYASGSLINPDNALKDGPTSSRFVDFDVRGQRIMRSGETLVWIGHAETSNLIMGVNGRLLVKLT